MSFPDSTATSPAPLFLRLLLDTVMEEGLPAAGTGRARLLHDWVLRKLLRDIQASVAAGGAGRLPILSESESEARAVDFAWEVMLEASSVMTEPVEGSLELAADCTLDAIRRSSPELARIEEPLGDPEMPNEAGLPLADGSVFRPSDLHGPVQTRISQDRPLVVLNACSSGRQGWTWSGLGGWADRWVRGCGCGAFIGPLWQVRDSAALAFSRSLYDALSRGETLGQAAREARRAAREGALGDPSWLAYTVYGHPNARVLLRGESSEEATESPKIAPALLQFVSDTAQARQARAPASDGPKNRPITPQQPGTAASTNLRIKRSFSDQDRDKFIEDAFELMASYFESSLHQLEQQNTSVGTRFRRIDSDHFNAAIYVQGEKKSSCRIWLDRGHLGDIAYFASDSGKDNTYNEILHAEDDGYTYGSDQPACRCSTRRAEIR